MSEKEPLISESGDLLTEPYDNDVKMVEDRDALTIFAGQEQVTVSYDLRTEEVRKGLLAFQKQTIFKKNIVYTVLLGIIFILYVIKAIYNPHDGLSIFLSFLCPALVAFIWLLPYNHRKKTAKAAGQAEDIFHLTVCEKGLVAGEGEDASYIFFENEPIEVTQYPDMLIISISKERIFVLPRRCAGEDEWEKAVRLLRDGLGERFQDKTK